MEIYRKYYILSILFFCCSDWVIAIDLSSSSVILSSVTSICLLTLSSELLISVIVFFQSFHLVLVYIFFSFAEAFRFFHLFQAVRNFSLKHFYHGCFKILSDKSHISVILMLTFFQCLFQFDMVFGMTSDFQLKPVHFHIMLRDSILFKPV